MEVYFLNFIRIAFRDISSIFKNRLIRVSVAAIVIVPLLYSMLYLDAFWDPYSKLAKMPVALVNNDVGGIKDGKKVNYGRDLVDKLVKDEELGFKLVDEATAISGLKSQKGFYSMFVVPKTFSEDILKVKDGTPKLATIYYTSNDKKNFLASQITGKAVVKLKSELTKQIVNEDTKVVFDNLYEIKDSLKKASDGSKEIFDNLKTAQDGSKKLQNGLLTLNNNIPSLKSGVLALYNGSGTLSNGMSSAQIGTAILYDGASELNNGLNKLAGQVPALSDGISKLYAGSTSLTNGIKTADDGLKNKILPGTKALSEGLTKLSTGLSSAGDGAKKLMAAGTALSSAVGSVDTKNSLVNGSASLSAGAAKLKAGTDAFKPGMQKLLAGADSLKNGASLVSAGVDSLITQVNTSQATLKNAVNTQLAAFLKSNPAALGDSNMQKFLATLNAINTAASDSIATAQISALQAGAHQVASGSLDLSNGLNTLGTGVVQFADSSVAFADGAVQYASGADQFAKGASQLADGAKSLGTGLSDAVSGANALNEGAIALDTALKGDFNNGLAALYQGSTQLNKGLNSLNGNVPALADGINQLKDGSNKLQDGLGSTADRAKLPKNLIAPTGTLLGGMNSLQEGSIKLKDGISTLKGNIPALADGTKKLYNGSIDLTNGLGKLKDGSKELFTKLDDGYTKVKNNLKTSSSDMATYVSEPVDINEAAINPLKNYGTGFTPYFIPLSLWVGAIMMFFIISEKVDDDIKASSMSLVIGKFISYGFIGTIQAVLASTVVLILGLKPSNIILYYLFNILMSFTFIAIIQCLVFLMGMAGRLLAIVLLILQLTSCAGTFPLEVVPKFFRVINPYMPFTYCVSGMREIISGITHTVLAKDVTILFVVMFAFMFLSVFLKKHADKVKLAIEQKTTA